MQSVSQPSASLTVCFRLNGQLRKSFISSCLEKLFFFNFDLGAGAGSLPFGYAPAVNCTFTPPIHLSTCFSEAIALLLLLMRRPIFGPVTPECARSSVRNTAESVFNTPPGCCGGVRGLPAVYSAGAGFVSWLGN